MYKNIKENRLLEGENDFKNYLWVLQEFPLHLLSKRYLTYPTG